MATQTLDMSGNDLNVGSVRAAPAAASAVPGVSFGSPAVGIYWGTGTPTAVLTAPKGSLFIRTDGSSTATRLYVNTDSGTTWTNFTSAA